MEDLREVTYQYVNVPDPTEAVARRQRVLQSETEVLMEETAARIVATGSNNLRIYNETNTSGSIATTQQFNDLAPAPAAEGFPPTPTVVRRSQQGTTPSRRSQASPRIFSGTNLRKRNIAQASQRHGFPHASPIHSTQRRAPRPTTRGPTASTAASAAPGVESSDFHAHRPPLP